MSAGIFTTVSEAKSFGGVYKKLQHFSPTLQCTMKLSVYLPPAAVNGPVPALYFLSGLTCNEDNFITKAGAIRGASKLGIALICPDTSPRNVLIEGQDLSWDFGTAAAYYLDATEPKWEKHYRMYSYCTRELPGLIAKELPVDSQRVSIFGHSVGGHGALICALKNPGVYKSVSAFAPMVNPTKVPWGEKAFTGFLGSVDAGKEYDATELVQRYAGPSLDVLVDQGSVDSFLESQLRPQNFVEASKVNSNVNINVRVQDGYDHGYFFIQTFVGMQAANPDTIP
ncbi:Alpha/Beta hydrolase protein [Cladochytrium replicatum]|nr:Alpha/Beta hydrolase protein [Cladochytrium replicatum]